MATELIERRRPDRLSIMVTLEDFKKLIAGEVVHKELNQDGVLAYEIMVGFEDVRFGQLIDTVKEVLDEKYGI